MKKQSHNKLDPSIFKISGLIADYLSGELTPEKQRILDSWLSESEHNKSLFNSITSKSTITSKFKDYKGADINAAYLRFLKKQRTKKRYRIVQYISVAAVALVFILSGWLLLNNKLGSNKLITQSDTENRKTLGIISYNKPLLKKYTGEEILIESSSYIEKGQESNLSDEELLQKEDFSTIFNEMIVPSKCDFHFTLNDGTMVWMNANSILRYPVLFAENERRIYVEGEVFLKVAKDVNRPFIVEVDEMSITVLGTSFNVRAYPNEQSQMVTLIEGEVKATIDSKDYGLSPGKQLNYQPNLQEINISKVDINDITAWKRGYYVFKRSTLLEVATTLKNWYDVNMIFNTEQSRSIIYTGVINKNESIETFISRLTEVSNVKCSLKDNNLYIY